MPMLSSRQHSLSPLEILQMSNALMTALVGMAVAIAPAPQPDLSGLWRFDVQTGSRITVGAMTIRADGETYKGKLITNGGVEALDIRSLTLNGQDMVMLVDSPNGAVTFRGKIGDGARSFSGTMTYFNGRTFPMAGIKQ
jgi:hypothetical protein